MNDATQTHMVVGDFNGLFGDLLCLTHDDSCITDSGTELKMVAGMKVTAFEEDIGEDGKPDRLLATGVVEPSPPDLACRGSRWVLRINARGCHHESDVV